MKNTLTENFTGPGTSPSFRFWTGSRYGIGWLVALLLGSGLLPSSVESASPALPQTFLDTTYMAPGGDFQSAIDNAQPGDILTGPVADSASGGLAAETSGCLISTAAYGSPLEPKVVMLRHFRDHYLLTHAPGRAFVKWYYRVSPPVADAIRNSVVLRVVTQITLWPLVALVWCIFNPETGVLVAFLAVVALAAGRDVSRRKPDEPVLSPDQDLVEKKRTFSPSAPQEIPSGPIPRSLRALPQSRDLFRGGFPSKKYGSNQRSGAHKSTRRRKQVFAGDAR